MASVEQRKIQIIADGTQVNATFNDMAAAARLLQNQLKKLPPESEEFAKKSEQLKGIRKNMNDLKGDVFGTEKAMKDLNQEWIQMTPLGGMLNTVTGALGKARAGVNMVTLSFKTLRGAIAATGIGLLVIALGSLINYLTTTQDGIDKVNKVLTPMRVIFEKLQGVVQNLGGNLFKGLGELLNGNLKEGFTTIKNGAKQAGDELGKAFTDGIKQGTDLADRIVKIEESEIALIETRARLNKQYQDAMEIAKDQSRSEAERLEAARMARDAEESLLEAEKDLMDQKIDRMKIEQDFNDTSREGFKELAELEAQRTQFEIDASKRRTKARSLENTISKEIHAENKKRSDEAVKKEEESQKKIAQLRAEYMKASLDLDRAIDAARIALMDEGFAKKEAKLQHDLEKEIAGLDERKEKILQNETLTQEERQKIIDQFAELEELKRQENRKNLEEAREKERQDDIKKQLDEASQDEEREILLLENSMMGMLDAEFRKKEALLQIQREYAAEKLAILEAAGEGETNQALKLKNVIKKIDQDIADNKIAEAQRAEDFKNYIQQLGFENARTWMQLGLDLLNEESKARKVLANAMKALEIAQVTMNGIKEVQAIWAGAATLGPIAGPIVGGLQTGIAVGRTAIAVNRIRSTQYADGGKTGSGKVIDMMLGRDGTWRMPDGTGTRNVGTFAKGGPVGSASFGVIGERGAEWVGPNWMLRSPKYANIFGYLEAERRKATPFAMGGATAKEAPQLAVNSSATADLQQFMNMIEEFGAMRDVMEQIRDLIEEWPTKLRVINDPRDIVDGVRVLNEIEADSRINR